jgi:hypothetical protein
MSSSTFAVVELLFVFGLMLAFCAWQFLDLQREKKKRIAKEQAETSK